jgi:O-antigen/teichoic acid export membrane protein
VLAQFFVGTFSLQVPSALLRFGSDQESEQGRRSIYTTALVLLLVSIAIFGLFYTVLQPLISEIIFDSESYQIHLTYLGISIAAEILGLLPFQLLRLQERPKSYVLFFAFKLTALVLFVWYFLNYRDHTVLGAIQGIMVANLVFLGSTMFIQLRNIEFRIDPSLARSMVKYSWPLIFTAVAGILLTISDRLIIKICGELPQVGLYGLAYKVGSLANLLILSSFNLGFLPIAFKKLHDPNFNSFFGKTLSYYIGVTALLTFGISLFGKEIIYLLSTGESDYFLAALLIPFIAYLFIFKALNNYFSYVFLLTKRTKYHGFITVIGVVLNIVMNFSLIPGFGMYGAIAATGMSYIVMAFLSYYYSQKQLPIQFEFRRISILLISCALFVMIGVYFNDLDFLTRIILKVLITGAFLLFLLFAVGRKSERDQMLKIYRLASARDGFRKIMKHLSD